MKKTTNKRIFAERLEEAMKLRGKNRKSLASDIGVSAQTISYYVNDERLPDVEILSKVAKALDISADWLIGLTTSQSVDLTIQEMHKILGLSDKTIIELKQEVEGFCRLFKTSDPEEALKKHYGKQLPYCKIIDVLVNEERSDTDDSVLSLLGEVLTNIESKKTYVELVDVELDEEGNKIYEKPVDNPPMLFSKDVLYIRLLKLQQAIIELKKNYDKENNQ